MAFPSELLVTTTYVLDPELSILDYLHGTSMGTQPSFYLTATVAQGMSQHDLWTAVASGRYATIYHGSARFRVGLTIWIANQPNTSYFYVTPVDGDIPQRIRGSLGILRIRRDFVAARFCMPIGRPVFPDLAPILKDEWDRVIPHDNYLRVALGFPVAFPLPATDLVYFVDPNEAFPASEEGEGGTEEEDGRVTTERLGGANNNHVERAVGLTPA